MKLHHSRRRDPIAVALGSNVRKRRRENNLTQVGLAERCGLRRSFISDIERGSRNLTIASVVRIAKALGTTASDLCDRIH
jgi:transcriptional regulator with XRE-family HTH domain